MSAPMDLPPGLEHGTHKGYNHGCRCLGEDGCKTYRNRYDRERYRNGQGAARRDPEYRAAVAEQKAQRRDDAREQRRQGYTVTVWNLTLESPLQAPDAVIFATKTTVSEEAYRAVNIRYATEQMAVKEFGRRYGGRPVARATWSEERIHIDEAKEWRKS